MTINTQPLTVYSFGPYAPIDVPSSLVVALREAFPNICYLCTSTYDSTTGAQRITIQAAHEPGKVITSNAANDMISFSRGFVAGFCPFPIVHHDETAPATNRRRPTHAKHNSSPPPLPTARRAPLPVFGEANFTREPIRYTTLTGVAPPSNRQR